MTLELNNTNDENSVLIAKLFKNGIEIKHIYMTARNEDLEYRYLLEFTLEPYNVKIINKKIIKKFLQSERLQIVDEMKRLYPEYM